MTDAASLVRALDAIPDPSGGGGLVRTGRAAPPRLANGVADVILEVSGLDADQRTALEAAVKQALAPLASTVRVAQTAERRGRTLIAVASGKGGVGKSTVSANLAVALVRAGQRVGLVDADIYGPSQPRLLGTEGVKPQAQDQRLQPVATPWGVPMLSMGQLVSADQAIAWRGPMASNALAQLVEADWSAADTLVVDLPPGTGDIQLTMIQRFRPTGAVIVSTPQDLALIDATRAIDLFAKANIPVIGLIENMAGYACPSCGHVSDPFGQGGAEATAARLGLPFLGRVPLAIDIRVASDAGRPPAADEAEDGPFRAIAARVLRWMNPSPSPRF